jgi:DNA primase
MIKGKKKVPLTQAAILQRISEFDIFTYYMTGNWKINTPTNSPFREDKHPSFIISNKYGKLNYIDFGDTKFRGDCFHFVRQLHNLPSLDTTLKMIDKDFNLGFSTGNFTDDYKKITSQYKQPESIGKRYVKIQVLPKKFTNDELKYWNEYYQDISDLKRENIYSIDKLFLNKKRFTLDSSQLTFGYYYDGYWKIYRPFETKKKKWMPNNVPVTMMDGLPITECDTMFINKSKKDYMVIKKLMDCTCAVQNEGIACFSPENIDLLKSKSKKQILSFDSDIAGVQSSLEITKTFDFDYCNVPKRYLAEGIKDWAELAKFYGLDTIEAYLKSKEIL